MDQNRVKQILFSRGERGSVPVLPEGAPTGYLVLYGGPSAAPAPEPPRLEAPKTAHGLDKLAYTVQEAAEVLGVSKPIVYELCHREDFPSLQIGKTQRISVELLAEWVRKQAGGDPPGA